MLAGSCEFQTIAPNEILHDHLVFGITDDKDREHLLRKTSLTLAITIQVAESIKIVNKISEIVRAVTKAPNPIENPPV